MKLTDKIFDIVEPTVTALGYELYEVEYQKEFDNWVLTLYIDHPDGVSLDDCELVSNAVDPVLDAADPIEQAYYLSVSSLGIDRPLKTDKDYKRNIGKVMDVKLYAPLNGKKEFSGTLTAFDEETYTIELKSGSETIERKKTALIRPHIDF
ncbi:MAG: ribosome maturation factor RimP [Eubacteriales bacterium]|nr:ribosome maturation factor RimP [Clostridiales bacterium]MDY2598062.1 ribosome maturation factor RimP [Eubacteriales bacterium]MDD6017844.1 ribosome maturation factor RimP [Clostridiales bacterium]MDD7523233.1 ribosome maturation factor RimP [Clostridiales bacterium]MDD7689231.1 ribosome maturation factor RimP [Clostridiales bacterium]